MTCECCGLHWGGLRDVSPTPKNCPWCGASEEEQMKALLTRATKEVAPIVERERAGEHITAETLEMRLS
jgi:hypothetical protein